MSGPLDGARVLEIGSIGPGPFAGMLLADMGAEVIRIERPGPVATPGPEAKHDPLLRGRKSVGLDLKSKAGLAVALRLASRCDALIEGYRPGVAERLGIGPEEVLAINPSLVYGRMTGWGQDGPLAPSAGHDINYIALTGALHAIGPAGGRPTPPLNLVGDFGGGGMLLAFGIVCGLYEARLSGRGQVVDAAMVDGASLLMAMPYGFLAAGRWSDERGRNALDGGAPFYDTYETRDHKFVAVGAIEPPFFAELLAGLDLDAGQVTQSLSPDEWPALRALLAERFKTRTRDEWCRVFAGRDACFTPVLSMAEAPRHPHNVARQTFLEVHGSIQPAPAPRFSRTPGQIQGPPHAPGADTEDVLRSLGWTPDELTALKAEGVMP